MEHQTDIDKLEQSLKEIKKEILDIKLTIADILRQLEAITYLASIPPENYSGNRSSGTIFFVD